MFGVKLFFISCLITIAACTKYTRGTSELGSLSLPIRFYLSSMPNNRGDNLQKISNCIEKKVGFRVEFQPAINDIIVSEALARGDAHFGYLGALKFVETFKKANIKSTIMRLEYTSSLMRSIIIAKAEKINAQNLNQKRFVFELPDSDIGFFVPRYLLREHKIFPKEVIFAGDYNLVLQALDNNLADAGAVSSVWFAKQYGINTALKVGERYQKYKVLMESNALPSKIIAYRADISASVQRNIISGLRLCEQAESAANIKAVFGGDKFVEVNEDLFLYLQNLVDEKELFLRTKMKI